MRASYVFRSAMRMDLSLYLEQNHVWHNLLAKPETVHTADASRETGIDLNLITKNLACEVSEGGYALLVVSGDRRVNLRKAAEALHSKNVRLLPFDQAESVTGYPPGGTPSIHHKTKMRVVIDKALMNHEKIFCGGGSRDKLLELKTEDVVRLENAIIADLSE